MAFGLGKWITCTVRECTYEIMQKRMYLWNHAKKTWMNLPNYMKKTNKDQWVPSVFGYPIFLNHWFKIEHFEFWLVMEYRSACARWACIWICLSLNKTNKISPEILDQTHPDQKINSILCFGAWVMLSQMFRHYPENPNGEVYQNCASE